MLNQGSRGRRDSLGRSPSAMLPGSRGTAAATCLRAGLWLFIPETQLHEIAKIEKESRLNPRVLVLKAPRLPKS